MSKALKDERGQAPIGHLAAGRLVLVVGPSGVGVDTLIDAARLEFGNDPSFHFVRRTITRPAGSVGEEHDPIDIETFRKRRDEADFALAWEAHGLGYGIPLSIEDQLRQGRTVVVNASRTVIEEARGRYPNLTVASVTASPVTLAQRLAGRNRETAEEIERRLGRAGLGFPDGDDVVTINNDDALETSVKTFLGLLR
ncbi:phosphonate metabolism protein/1,5-bisphosphokinase (PRPP-forming) PhnN [Hwanghaeella grinnelliae]|uniref:Ribose 1,5-bisphosphate phosphokinase PhnN n=1 Tax=Hwanghaeella grinnelliae TaxID=2500179 RepID=A0A437QKY1_9PROT|nr:phosphonate metabolism protein/1,5-bisphosphokinase (PRPP-forming) PhnN [Hwanghaeella grinnelliae]RVU35161.1 phosphonate metabolism protein/1,5-bisphosphokinase (PRPP-forming) PhnN [Hwanghaeella grinnelliae]